MGTVLVTGVSRRASIGWAVARRLQERGDRVVVSSWQPHDAEHPWGADDLGEVLAGLGDPPHVAADLSDPDAPARLVEQAVAVAGPLTGLVAAHARSASGDLDAVTAAELDACLAVNARGSVLLTQAFARQYRPGSGRGAVVLFTSGQHRGPMPGEIAYALSKAAIAGITATLADAVADRGITVTCLNPGPTDTGWADPAMHAWVAERFPSGRWTTPEEIAAVVAWLLTDDAAPMTGQVVDAESGWRR